MSLFELQSTSFDYRKIRRKISLASCLTYFLFGLPSHLQDAAWLEAGRKLDVSSPGVERAVPLPREPLLLRDQVRLDHLQRPLHSRLAQLEDDDLAGGAAHRQSPARRAEPQLLDGESRVVAVRVVLPNFPKRRPFILL